MPFQHPGPFNIAEYFVDRPAREHPSRVAILGEPSSVTYEELRRAVNRAANALRFSGFKPGDRVLIVLPDSLEFIAAFFGAAKIGAVAVPVNPMAHAADYAYFLSDSSARVAIVHEAAWNEFSQAAATQHVETIVVVAASSHAGKFHDARNWAKWLESQPTELEALPTLGHDSAFFLYTSGSGGTPKAAVHQHKDMLACSQCYAQRVLDLRTGDITFSASKLFFAYGLGNGMYFPFSVGASTVLSPDRPRPERIAEVLARYRPTIFFAVPTLYAALLHEADRGLRIDFSSVRMAVSAGEILPPEIFERFAGRFGLRIVDGIGSTEMLQMFISNRPGDTRPGSCGIEVPGYEAFILDDAGQPVAQGEIGNLWVKGPSAFVEYWKKPELTAVVKRGELVYTGDKFYQEASGYYHYCGRSDDMLKVAGMWVSPGEVENALLAHPQVAEAAVVGKKDDAGLVRPVAFLVLRDTAVASPQLGRAILAFVRERLLGYKCPHEIHFLAELPKTATGKIQRFRLRASSGA